MVEHSKPFPDIYLKACKELKCNPHDTYAVEDSYNGIESAVKAGLKTIMIPDSLPPVKEYDSKIFTRFDSLVELSEYFAIRALMEKLWQKYDYASILLKTVQEENIPFQARDCPHHRIKYPAQEGMSCVSTAETALWNIPLIRLKLVTQKNYCPDRKSFDKAEELKENFTIEDTERMEDEVFHSFQKTI